MTAPTIDPAPPAGPSDRRAKVWLGVGIGTMVAIALFWAWVFSGAPKRVNPDRLEDREWVERAQATCAATMARIDERTTAAGEQTQAARAADIDTSTGELRAMLAELEDPLPGPPSDREVVEPWLADWRDVLENRDDYAEAIRRDADAKYLTVEKFGDQLETVIETFADVNDMPACAPAGDVG